MSAGGEASSINLCWAVTHMKKILSARMCFACSVCQEQFVLFMPPAAPSTSLVVKLDAVYEGPPEKTFPIHSPEWLFVPH